MAIQQLQIQFFRSLKNVTWTPGSLNLLVGPNGSGKSNLLRCLELISTTAQGRLEESIPLLGGVIPLTWDHKSPHVGWKLRIDPVDQGRDHERDALTYEVRLGRLGSGYEILLDNLGNYFKFERQEEASPYWIIHREGHRASYFDQQQARLNKIREEDSATPEGFNPEESLLSQISDFQNRIPNATRRAISNWQVFHDVHVEYGSAIRSPATTQVSKRLMPNGANLVPVLHTLYSDNRAFKAAVDEGMRAGFGAEYEELVFQPAAAQQIQLAVRWRSSSQPHAGSDLSDGTLRFLFLLTVLANPESNTLIAVDEPEVGLHPSMLPIVAEYANAASEQSQIVLTSHSPEFLDAFSDFSPTVTVCHWENGESTLHTLRDATFEKWLQHYRLGQLFRRGELESLLLPTVDEMPPGAERPILPSEQEVTGQG
jgi:predicted ATPase